MMRDTKKQQQLYCAYHKELDEMQGLEFDREEALSFYSDLLTEGDNYWIDIRQRGIQVGFFTMCPQPCCHPDADFFLRDAYVMPEYRKRGLMKAAVKRWLKLHPATYCILILDTNIPAYNCWMSIFEETGYEKFKLRDMELFHDVPNITMYGFRPKEA